MTHVGFREVAFHQPENSWMTVGRWTWPGPAGVHVPGGVLFSEFVADTEQAWQRQKPD